MGFFGKLFFGFLVAVAVLGNIGFFLRKRDVKNGVCSPEKDEILSSKAVENVPDLNDRFNRARYQDQDGQ